MSHCCSKTQMKIVASVWFNTGALNFGAVLICGLGYMVCWKYLQNKERNFSTPDKRQSFYYYLINFQQCGRSFGRGNFWYKTITNSASGDRFQHLTLCLRITVLVTMAICRCMLYFFLFSISNRTVCRTSGVPAEREPISKPHTDS